MVPANLDLVSPWVSKSRTGKHAKGVGLQANDIRFKQLRYVIKYVILKHCSS